MTAPVSNDTI